MTEQVSLSLLAGAALVPAEEPGWNADISPAERRRSPRIWQMALVAAERACAQATGHSPGSVVVGTALGALDETRAFLQGVFAENTASPRSFIASVHNSMGGKLALDLGIRGPNITVCDGQNSLATALLSVGMLSPSVLPALVVVVDEHIELLQQLAPHLDARCRAWFPPEWQDGAVGLLVDRAGSSSRTIGIAGPRPSPSVPGKPLLTSMAKAAFGTSEGLLDLGETNRTYLSPGRTLAQTYLRSASGQTLIPSYCPTAAMAAIVQLCI